MNRLESLSPIVASELLEAPISMQRAAAATACELAILQARVDYPPVKLAFDKVKRRESLDPIERSDLETLVEDLDEKYFDLKEAAEEGRIGPEKYREVFNQARAVSALLAASEDDSFEGASEAVYEAAHAVLDRDALLRAVLATLDH